jgi:hypothetical protein
MPVDLLVANFNNNYDSYFDCRCQWMAMVHSHLVYATMHTNMQRFTAN